MSGRAELVDLLQLRAVDGAVNLAGYDPADTPLVSSEKDAESGLEDLREQLFDAHELMFAEEKRALLLVLQGLDCSGKNGTIKHVVIAMNPAGVRTAEFTEPTEEELEHHFLWRYERALPKHGELGVFSRSYYEDLIVPRVMGELSDDELDERVDAVNEFEAELTERGTTVLKCMLHISYDEQRERFLRRLRRDDKRWKFDPSDIETRRLWNEYQAAYGHAIGATDTDTAPWYIIPSDHKWYRNWAVANLLLATFDRMGNAYPMPDFDLADLRSRLEPPN